MVQKNLTHKDAKRVRFDIVVFNFERIISFLENFHRIKNFRPGEDRLLILDCSVNFRAEREKVIEFANSRGWSVGKEIQFVRRRNWGIDQGGRVDYLAGLTRATDLPQYIWQFQEHYLDLYSDWSKWPAISGEVSGRLKEDTIPDNFFLDLDLCERIYEEDPSVAVLYADRAKLGVFRHADGKETFFADGANFSVRTRSAAEAFPENVVDAYQAIYDGTYEWALFMELDLCARLTGEDRLWHDLVTHQQFDSVAALKAREDESGTTLHQSSEPFYGDLFAKYEARLIAVLSERQSWRKIHSFVSLRFVAARSSKTMLTLKRAVASIGLGVVMKRMNHYLTGVLRHH